jgi:shikimate dehydrogenase
MRKVTAATRVCFMVGHPVDKARTPGLFNEWASFTKRDVVMASLSVAPAGISVLFAAMRSWENCIGAVVTYPHKQTVYRVLDEADPAARFNEACNVVRRELGGRLVGTMTDGIGCVSAMEKNGVQLNGTDFLLVGAGGAGSAIAYETAQRGARRIAVLDLDRDRQDALVSRLTESFPSLSASPTVPDDFRFDVACNATPLGMNGETALPYPVEALRPHTLVVDVVPTPALTPWLEAARHRGLNVQTGPEMVAAQFGHVAGHLLGVAAETIEHHPAPTA